MSTLLTIPETAKALGLTAKAVEKRIERGTIQSLRREGRRVIPSGEITRLQTLAEQALPPIEQRVSPGGDANPLTDLSAFLQRLETLAAENGRFRALQEVAESERQQLHVELFKTRAHVAELEAKLAEAPTATAITAGPRRRTWWGREKPRKTVGVA